MSVNASGLWSFISRLLPHSSPRRDQEKPAMDAAPPPRMPADVRVVTGPAADRTPRPSSVGGPIKLDTLNTPFVKDPSFVADGKPLGGVRYIAFGDLRRFYLKGFELSGKLGQGLKFRPGEVPLRIAGLPANLDSPWAPQLIVNGDKIEMYYCAGEMPPPEGPRWPTFRLRKASMPLGEFEKQAKLGQGVEFKDEGPILGDLAPFGPNDKDFGMIDPHLYVNPQGRAYMTYTVVRGGIPGKRAHEEFVRYREVDPQAPTRALGPDKPLYDGKAGTPDDGVAEAQDVVTLNGRTYVFVSSRPGDADQKLLMAPVGPDLGTLRADQLKPFLAPGGEPWRAKALGSSSATVIHGTPYMVYQGLGADNRFTLGWMKLDDQPAP